MSLKKFALLSFVAVLLLGACAAPTPESRPTVTPSPHGALTLSFEAPGASGATNAWEFSSPPGGGVGYETLRIKVKLKRKS